jgi:hypothetical protein
MRCYAFSRPCRTWSTSRCWTPYRTRSTIRPDPSSRYTRSRSSTGSKAAYSTTCSAPSSSSNTSSSQRSQPRIRPPARPHKIRSFRPLHAMPPLYDALPHDHGTMSRGNALPPTSPRATISSSTADTGHETLFSIRVHRVMGSLCGSDDFDFSDGLHLSSSVRVDLSHLTHLTLTSERPYNWNRFFRGGSWTSFFRCTPSVRVLRLYVNRPADIIGALAAQTNNSSPHRSSPPSASCISSAAETSTPPVQRPHRTAIKYSCASSSFGRIFGIPIESIVCSPPDAKDDDKGAITDADVLFKPNVLSFVDSNRVWQPRQLGGPTCIPATHGRAARGAPQLIDRPRSSLSFTPTCNKQKQKQSVKCFQRVKRSNL